MATRIWIISNQGSNIKSRSSILFRKWRNFQNLLNNYVFYQTRPLTIINGYQSWTPKLLSRKHWPTTLSMKNFLDLSPTSQLIPLSDSATNEMDGTLSNNRLLQALQTTMETRFWMVIVIWNEDVRPRLSMNCLWEESMYRMRTIWPLEKKPKCQRPIYTKLKIDQEQWKYRKKMNIMFNKRQLLLKWLQLLDRLFLHNFRLPIVSHQILKRESPIPQLVWLIS